MNKSIDTLAERAHNNVNDIIRDIQDQKLTSPDQVYRAFSGMAQGLATDWLWMSTMNSSNNKEEA